MRNESITTSVPAAGADGELDVSTIGRAIAQKKAWVIVPTVACLVGSAAFVTLATPKYTATADVLIENQENYFTRPTAAPGSADAQTLAIDPEAVASQVQIVMSRELGKRAIAELGLKGNPEFDPTAKGPGLLSMLFGGGRKSATQEDSILEAYFEQLNVFAVVKTRVLQIEFTSSDPEFAARAANKVADLYLNIQSDAKRDAARASATSIADLVSDLRSKASTAEGAAEAWRAEHGLTIGANNITMTGQQLSDLSTQVGLAKAAQAESQAKARMLRDMVKQGRLGDVTDVANNELIRKMAGDRSTLRAQIASESRTLLPGHPRIKELNAQLEELDSQIRLAVERTARALENDASVAGARLENLATALAQQKKEVGGSSADEAHARELDRVAKQFRDQLEANMAKYQEATARENSQSTPGDARVVSRAIAPLLPSFPKKIPIVAFGTFAGLVLSTGYLVSSELMSGRAYASASQGPEFAADAGKPAAPIRTPATPDAPIGVDARRQRRRGPGEQPVSNALTGLAARLLAAPAGEFAQRVLVVSEADEASARDVAASLGKLLARDHRAILVEVDDELGGGDSVGLGDILAGTADFEASIQREPGSRLHLLCAGDASFEYDKHCEVVLDALSRTYDFVIVVAPPLSTHDTAVAIAPDVECAVLACAGEPDALAMQELTHAGAGQVVAIDQAARRSGRSAA